MTDRVYPSSKPNNKTATAITTTTTQNPKLPPPPNKTQLPNSTTNTTTRHPYRPNPTTNRQAHNRKRRGCFYLFCFWSILFIILLLTIAAISGFILYLLYRPHRPTFSVAGIKISKFNLTTTEDDTTRLTSELNITISTRNPNKKIIFYYDPFTITCLSDETLIAKGSFPHSLVSNPDNITIIRSSLSSNSLLLDIDTVNVIKANLKKKSGLPLKILLDTEARVKVESIRTKKVGIRIKCEGIHSLIPKSSNGTSSVTANVSAAKCKLDLRIKIWKWTF